MSIEFQLAFVRYIRSMADWRRERANEYDADPRNLQSASGLDDLASYVLLLADDDEELEEISALTNFRDIFEPGQQLHLAVARYHYFQQDTRQAAFITYLVELARADQAEAGHLAGRLPEGEEDPFRG